MRPGKFRRPQVGILLALVDSRLVRASANRPLPGSWDAVAPVTASFLKKGALWSDRPASNKVRAMTFCRCLWCRSVDMFVLVAVGLTDS